MTTDRNKKCLIISVVAHVVLLLIFALSFEFSSPLIVVENTNKTDVISAVVLGESAKSKILPQKPTPKPVEKVEKEEPKPKELPKEKEKPAQQIKPVDKDAIALKVIEKKKLEKLKKEQELLAKKQREALEKDLLADIEKEKKKRKKQKEKQLQAKYEKMLREQAEKSLRQQLLDENINVKGTQTREASGIVDKYRALILQSISEHWIVPSGANKRLYAELMIRLAPGGVVLDVQITKSSGDPSLDSSARAAVLKASPLPVPSDSGEFEPFRKFVLKVKPENVIDSGSAIG